jgi:RNA polymerase-binding transcription factor DksA
MNRPTMSTRSHLTEAQRAILQRALQSRMDDMVRQGRTDTQGLSQADHALEVARQDADDATQQAGAHEVEASVADIDSAEFAALRAALLRVPGPAYGVCADCGAPIPYERLLVEPQALRCRACASFREGHG